MAQKTFFVQITTFCKHAGRNSEIWSDAIGSELTSADGNRELLSLQTTDSGGIDQVTVGNKTVKETLTINNLQTKFRSIGLQRRVYLRVFKPDEFAIELRSEAQKRALREKQKAEIEFVRKQEEASIKKLNACLIEDFLSSNDYYNTYLSGSLSEKSYRNFRANFVKKWIECRENGSVDKQQAHAIASIERDTVVTARAGSGKTATLVNRILFLHKHCNVDPSEFLVLAFNRNAAEEIRNRLKISTGKDFRNVMTFHSLAYSIEQPNEAILYDEPRLKEFNQSSVIQSIIDFYLKDEKQHEQIRNVMLSYFRQDWEKIAQGGFNLSPSEMLEFRRNAIKFGLDGRHFKSYGEKKLADIMFEHGISYEYEKVFYWNNTAYRPDFTITLKDYTIIIEYFGLKGSPDYDEQINEKRSYWTQKANCKLLEITPHQIAWENFEDFLINLLKKNGLSVQKLSDEEIWERLQDRAVDEFSKLATAFVGRVRQNSYSPAQLKDLVRGHEFAFPFEEDFLNIMQQIYGGYIQRIAETGEDDFSGLMERAAKKLKSGNYEFYKKNYTGNIRALKFLMIDEFQDFTALFYSCVSAIKKANNQINIFCVGDDWQAINGFAGSDLQYFKSFGEFFGDHTTLNIQTNYRSSLSIVNAGNQLMDGQGPLAKASSQEPGTVNLVALEMFEPTDLERLKFGANVFIPAILRLIRKLTKENKTVAILSRTNTIPWFLGEVDRNLEGFSDYLKKTLLEREFKKIMFSTIHSFKGQQSDAVILIDFKKKNYPFLHPKSFFSRIFGDSIQSVLMDEQRLLYVALTRAKEQLFLISEVADTPDALKSFATNLSYINWDHYRFYGISDEASTAKIVSIIGNTFPLRSVFKSLGYRWVPGKHKSQQGWKLRIDFGDVSFKEYFAKKSWVKNANNLQIVIRSEDGSFEKKLEIRDGKVL